MLKQEKSKNLEKDNLTGSPIKSYESILKSTSIIGGSQFLIVLIGMVKVKFTAVLLGPLGIGLASALGSINQTGTTLFGFGLANSGIREISSSLGENDSIRVSKLATTLYFSSLITGLFGMIAVVLFSSWLSIWVFGTPKYEKLISILSICIFLENLSGAQLAVLQGHRKIVALASIRLKTRFLATVLAVVYFYHWGLEGIVPAMLTTAILKWIISLFFLNKIALEPTTLRLKEFLINTRGLAKLGLALVWNTLLISLVAVITRSLVNHEGGLHSLGIYSAAYGISAMLVNFVLQAMATDYYPRLSRYSSDNKSMSQLVNEQFEIGILLALPIILFATSFSELLINILYTHEFQEAHGLLSIFIIGSFFRVLQWPLGYIALAKKKAALFAITETTFQILHLLLIYLGIKTMGIVGVAIAYPVVYLIAFPISIKIGNILIGFNFNYSTRLLLGKSILAVLILLTLSRIGNDLFSLLASLCVSTCFSIICLSELLRRLPETHPLNKLTTKIFPFLNPTTKI